MNVFRLSNCIFILKRGTGLARNSLLGKSDFFLRANTCAPAGFTTSERSELAMRSSPSRRYVLAIAPSCPRRLGGQFIRRWCNGFRPLRAASAVPAAPCTRCTIYRIYATTATLAQADELELELELEVSSRSGCCAARRSASVLASAGCSSACRESEERCVSAHDWLLQLAARC